MHDSLQHGPRFERDGTTIWRLWAPRARQVELVLHPGHEERKLPMRPLGGGWYECSQSGVPKNARYLFELDNGRRLPDPASRWQPDGVHHASAFFDPGQFAWTDAGWRGLPLADLVFYELHVGTFTPEGTFDAIIPRLPELRELGVTAVEIMPVAQFAGQRGWGYDGVYPFAVQNSYGGPQGLQRLVDACHAEGLALFLDVIYNHFGPEGNYFGEFGPYFTEKYRTPWGSALNYDGRGSDDVRQLVLDNVAWWLREFHVDGLRLDAVHAIYDSSSRHLLREISEVAAKEAEISGRQIQVVAESNLNNVRLIDAPDKGGYGLDAQWSDDFHHCVHTLLTGEREGYYSDFGPPEQLAKSLRDFFVYDGCYSPYRQRRHGAPVNDHSGEHFVIAIQNHDQVGNRALGERFGALLTPEQQRFAAALMLLAPNLPLLFMGEEYGETNPFPFFCDFHEPALIEGVRRGRAEEFASFTWPERLPDPFAEETFVASRLSWNWKEDKQRSGLRNLYQTLLTARRTMPALRDYTNRDARWHPSGESEGIVELMRGNWQDPATALVAYFNCTPKPQTLPPQALVLQSPAAWQIHLSSEESRFGGLREPIKPEEDTSWNQELLPFEAQLFTLKTRTSP